MRHMQEKTFCPVCQEGLWTNLLSRLVTLIKTFLMPASHRGPLFRSDISQECVHGPLTFGIWTASEETSSRREISYHME